MRPVGETVIIDPSEIYRPESSHWENDCEREGFRNFSAKSELFQRVYQTYTLMHTNQCVDFVRAKHDKWLTFNHGNLTVMEALEALNSLVDESDPDVDFPNSFHAFQTAEGIRKKHPDKGQFSSYSRDHFSTVQCALLGIRYQCFWSRCVKFVERKPSRREIIILWNGLLYWFQLAGLIHDLGKMMAIWGENQYCVVGDTFPVGCQFASSIVYADSTFTKNPDSNNPTYNTKYGMYEPGCGLSKVLMSWGHDEYMYRVLLHNKTTLPEEALYCVRFHSFYPWHTGGDYDHLCDDTDRKMMKWVKEFNQYDLYTKCPDLPDVESLKQYYQTLIDKYIPGVLQW